MVANQVAVAQIVSITSFLEDAADTHDRMGGWLLTLESQVPTSKPLWSAMKSNPIESVYSGFRTTANTLVPVLDKLIWAFMQAQQIHHSTTLVDMITVSEEVIKRNDPQAKISTGVFSIGNTAFQLNNGTATQNNIAQMIVLRKPTVLLMWLSVINRPIPLRAIASQFQPQLGGVESILSLA